MTDKIEFDGDQLDPGFVRVCAHEAEAKLYNFVNDPVNNPMIAQMMSMFLNRVGLMRGMLKAIVDIHNGVVTAHRESTDPSVGTDVSAQLQQLALLATGCAVNFGDEIGHIVVGFKPENGTVTFDNMAGRGVRAAPDEPTGDLSAGIERVRKPGAPAEMAAPYGGKAPEEDDGAIDPLLAAHDKGLH